MKIADVITVLPAIWPGTFAVTIEDEPLPKDTQLDFAYARELENRYNNYPDMLAALKEAADYMGLQGHPEHTLEKARQAIQKAEEN